VGGRDRIPAGLAPLYAEQSGGGTRRKQRRFQVRDGVGDLRLPFLPSASRLVGSRWGVKSEVVQRLGLQRDRRGRLPDDVLQLEGETAMDAQLEELEYRSASCSQFSLSSVLLIVTANSVAFALLTQFGFWSYALFIPSICVPLMTVGHVLEILGCAGVRLKQPLLRIVPWILREVGATIFALALVAFFSSSAIVLAGTLLIFLAS